MIKRGSGVAVWRQVAEDIQGEIARGRLSVGERLPTEMELADRYKVNRHTVRRAIAMLASDGYLEAERGRGTFVSRRPIAYPITAQTRFSDIVSAQDLQPGGRLIGSSVEPAQGVVAEKLGVKADEPLIRLETLRVVEGRPVVIGTGWFVAAMVPSLVADYAETGSITKALAKAGFEDYRRQSSWVSASVAEGGDCGYLQLEPGDPLLVVDSVNVTADGRPLQYSHARFSGKAVQLVVEN